MESAAPATAVVSPPATPNRILPANLLFLITVLLLLLFGSGMQYLWPREGLIGTELLCILLPAWLFARQTGSTADALRMKWTGFTGCALGLLAGAALIPVAAAMDAGSKWVLGYEFSLPDGMLPVGPAQSATYILGVAVAAPFCEEMVFHGYILRAYERAGIRPRTAVLAVAALFTAWHMSPARAAGVATVALTGTYLAWRTRSIWPGMAAHLGANGTATALVLARSDPGARAMLALAVPCALVVVGCVSITARRFVLDELAEKQAPGGWWPLWVAGTLIALVGSAEVAANHWHLFPAHPREEAIIRVQAPWTAPVRLQYEIHQHNGLAGTAEYRITPQADTVAFDATLRFQTDNELTDGAAEVRMEGTWDQRTMRLRRLAGTIEGQGRSDRFEFTESGSAQETGGFAGGYYSMAELPWRLSAARTIEERTGRPVAVPMNEALLKGHLQHERHELRVQGETREEAIGTPAGRFRTVRIAIGQDVSAWYDVQRPHTIVQLRTTTTVWTLKTATEPRP